MKTIAIIGASNGQLPICKKAKEMGLYTICFAWKDGAVCRDIVDEFFPISLMNADEIVLVCKDKNVDGVVTNASDFTSRICAYVAERLNLPTTSYEKILTIQNKLSVRECTNKLKDVLPVQSYAYEEGKYPNSYPCIVKPVIGTSKIGVSFAANKVSFDMAIEYAKCAGSSDIIIEEYVAGREFSVESLSYKGRHYVVQITDKESSGAPHFVELSHHQPTSLSTKFTNKIRRVIPHILRAVGYTYGASHIEMKIDDGGNLYLIEINPRGGGDHISSDLIRLSTGYDYLRGLIDIALDQFQEPRIEHKMFSGIYYLCEQTKNKKSFFTNDNAFPWIIEKKVEGMEISKAMGNYDRNGYLIYQSNHKIEI